MKTVILSDTHLTHKVQPRKFDYLKSIIEQADKVILAGDFWDGFLVSFDTFVNSKWQELFPLLLEREAVYIYGNHDLAEWCDERVGLFSVASGIETTLSEQGQTYHVTHGHKVFTSFEDKYPIFNRKISLRFGSNIDRAHKLVWGDRFLREGSAINQPMLRWVGDNLRDGEILVTGHSHYPEIDLANRFVNSGFIGSGYGNYASIDDRGPRIIKERY